MNETLQEFVDSRGQAIRVDREAAVVRGVKILGLTSRNRRSYLAEALAKAACLYEGAKVHVNHPKGQPGGPRDYQDRIGSIRDVAYRPGEGLFADFHFNPKHALAEQLLWDAEHAPENVGFSHNVEARTRTDDGQTVVEEIVKVQSVDLVADPATTRGLFEAAGDDALVSPSSLTVEALRRIRPDLVDEMLREASQEIQQLRDDIQRAQAQQAKQSRRELALRLLREFGLPAPDSDDPQARLLLDQRFLESLYEAPDEAAMRMLAAERARLLRAAATAWVSPAPVSREQGPLRESLDTKAFVRAIT